MGQTPNTLLHNLVPTQSNLNALIDPASPGKHMAKRYGLSKSYEQLFEGILRDAEVLYLAIDEAKRPIYAKEKIKNFDFIVSSFNGKFLIDIKGKKFDYGYGESWENWIKDDDISGLKVWASHFNAFTPLLVFVYHLRGHAAADKFQDIYRFKNRRYGIVAIDLSTYYTNAKTRSKKWGAIYVSREKFQHLAKPISFYLPELKKSW